MYSKLPSFVFGFHGCDKQTKEAILHGHQKDLLPSMNTYDWLGGGIYFWEQNPQRALDFALKAKESPNRYSKSIICEPAVIGAVIDLGNCLNLMDSVHIERLRSAYLFLKQLTEANGTEMPRNRGNSEDKPLRELDRAVIETLHQYIDKHSEEIAPYDSVRGLFLEGDNLYPGAFFKKETHIQLCVRNINCIKGYFDPREKCAAPYITAITADS